MASQDHASGPLGLPLNRHVVRHIAWLPSHHGIGKERPGQRQKRFFQARQSKKTLITPVEFHLIPKKNLTFFVLPNTIAVINVIIGPLPELRAFRHENPIVLAFCTLPSGIPR